LVGLNRLPWRRPHVRREGSDFASPCFTSVCELGVRATAKLRTLPLVHARVLDTYFALYAHDDVGVPMLLPPAAEPYFVSNVTVLQDIATMIPQRLASGSQSGGNHFALGRGQPQSTMSQGEKVVKPMFFDSLMTEFSNLIINGFNSNKPVIGNVNESALATIVDGSNNSPANASAANASAASGDATSGGVYNIGATPRSMHSRQYSQDLNDLSILKEPYEEDVVATMHISSFNTCLRMVGSLGEGKLVSDFRNVHTNVVLAGNKLPLVFDANGLTLYF